MKRFSLTSKLSLVVTVCGGMMLSKPAPAAAEETYDCRESVAAYCQWVADNFCSKGAMCIYEIATCQIIDAQCTQQMT